MRVMLLGGSGFIGSRLAQSLAERGHTVHIPSRTPEKAAQRHREGVTFTHWDGKNPAQLALLLQDVDAVVNLLGESIADGRWTMARKQRIVGSRLRAGAALVDAFASMERRPQVMIQASAVGFYGSWSDMDQAPLCTEQSPPGRNFLADTADKWEASTLPLELYPDVRRCVIRTAPVLGPHGGMLQKLLPVFRFWLGGPVGSGRQPFCWIHLSDEAEAIIFLLEHPELSGDFNLASPETVCAETFARTLGEVLQRPARLRVPAFVLRLLLGEMADEVLLTGQRAFPRRLLEAGFRFSYPELRAALEASV